MQTSGQFSIATNLISSDVCDALISPSVRDSKTVLDSGFQYLSVELGFWIPIVSGIPDSLSCSPDSISKIFPDSGIRIPLQGEKWYGFYQRK